MEKIKNILHPHGHDKDRETAGGVTHDNKGTTGTAAQSSTGTSGTTSGTTPGHLPTPIYDQMTGHGHTASTTGETSNTSNVGAGTGTGTSTSTGLGGERQVGTSDNSHLGDSSRLSDRSHQGDISRPQVSSGPYDGNSEASIKSGVIGFSPGSSGHGHAAMSNSSAQDRLNRNQVVGQGNTGTNTGSGLKHETIPEQSSTLPATSGTDRSFPLSGGVATGHHDESSTAHGLNTNERELGTKDRELASGDHHGREGLAVTAAAAAVTGAATQGRHNDGREPEVGTFSDRTTSPTGHSHLTSSVREHNIHPDALHAAGARPLNDSDAPGHGPPNETPHLNTGTLLDYEKAYGSDPHTKHTGLLDYRPHTHRTGTDPHIPGEFPSATPENERATPILGGAGSTSATGAAVSHDLRHTGTLDEPVSKSTDSSGHHLGRDAAIAGGVGAAGLGAAAHHKQETPASGSGNLYDDKNPYSSKSLDPRVTGGEAGESQHHYGRDAGLAGAGAAAAGGLAYSGSHDQPPGQRTLGSTAEDPASKTIGPHSSNIANILDPRVQPDPAKQKDHTTTGPQQSDTLNRADPKVDNKAGQHHYGRDAAVVGGAGAAGYGAYEAAKTYGEHRSTQPGASMQEQRYDPTATGAHASNPVPATSEYNYNNPDVAALASTTGAGAPGHQSSTQQPYTTAQMAQQASSQPPQAYKAPEIGNKDLGPEDHSSRNAALGAGAGLAGATAVGYGLSHRGDNNEHFTTAPPTASHPSLSSQPQQTGSLNQGQQHPANTEQSQSHTGRDAALAGGAGAAAGAGAGYAYAQHKQPQFDPKEQERLNKETAKRQHDLEKKHDKEVHKLEKEHEKDLKKHEKDHHDGKEKSGGILGFLHRDKSKKERSPENTPRRSDEHHYGRDAAIAGGVGAGAAGVAAHERHSSDSSGSGYKARNRLQKDPPAGHPAHDTLHANNRIGVDGPIGTVNPEPTGHTGDHHYGRDAAIAGGAVGAGTLGVHELSKDRTEPSTTSGAPGHHTSGLTGNQTSTLPDRTSEHHYGRDAALAGGAVGAGGLAAHELHDKRTDPTSTTVGHTGTGLAGSQQATLPGNAAPGSVLGNREQQSHTFVSGKREHIGVDGPIGDPNMISGDRQTRKGVWGAHPVEDLTKDHTVIEPRTGLPMNVGRYGDGAGGIDGGPVGHRHPETVAGQVLPGSADRAHSTTNWDEINKKNTIL